MKSLSTNRPKYVLNCLSLLAIFSFFLLMSIIISLILSSPQSSEASTVSASDGSAYTASISNNDSVTIPVTPTSSQAVYTNNADDSKISFSSTCSAGAYVYINTDSSSNDLTRTGEDSGKKTISSIATGDTELSKDTWGFSKDSGKAFAQVPVSGSPVVLYESTKAETTTIPVIYGIKTDNTLPSGNYTNNIIYTVAVKPACLTYTLKFDLDGGTGASGVDYSDRTMNYGDKLDISSLGTPTKSGYTFTGWSNGSSSLSGNVDPNPDKLNAVTVKAEWTLSQTVWSFDYTGSVQTFTAPAAGYYKLEVWGAQGGNASKGPYLEDGYKSSGGLGAYSIGTKYFDSTAVLYIVVGGHPTTIENDANQAANYSSDGGYNGGGSAKGSGAGGGGATHIGNFNSTLLLHASSSGLYILAGGGGGTTSYNGFNKSNDNPGHGGGMSGSPGATTYQDYSIPNNAGGKGGAQNSGGAGGVLGDVANCTPSWAGTLDNNGLSGSFGRGGNGVLSPNGSSYGSGGGGGGYYGGGSGSNCGCYGGSGGGGGSGYIGGVSSGRMYQYATGCTPSTSANTYTVCTSNTGHAIASAANTGNGYARITYLGTSI